jgi:hypothetical protein
MEDMLILCETVVPLWSILSSVKKAVPPGFTSRKQAKDLPQLVPLFR